MILDTKLSRKMLVRKKTGLSCARKDWIQKSLAPTVFSKELFFIAVFDVSSGCVGTALGVPIVYTAAGQEANERRKIGHELEPVEIPKRVRVDPCGAAQTCLLG